MADDKIKYSDIIEPDDSIEKLVKQLGELNQSYETMVNAIRAGADRIVHSIKSASGATSEGRRVIDEASAATARLERAQRELTFALSDTGKQVAWLKAQTSDANKTTVEQQRYIKQAISSYDRLKSDLKQMVELYKSLTDAERADSAMGQQLLDNILNLKNQIKALDDQMRPHIQTLTEVQKAEQRLAYLQSDEGQRLLDLKAKIAEVTSARKQQKAITDPLVQAQEKLAYAQSQENQQLKLYSTQIQEANRIAQLQAQIANSAEGSYNRLSAQYALNKIELNKMSAAERETTNTGKQLEEETRAIYQQMIKLQEATGNYRLSVGNYAKSWDGLGRAVSNVMREVPSLAVSVNTFFLAISNNIPMLADEINRLREQNIKLRADGKKTVSVTKSIIKSLFSWNSALVLVITAFTLFGDKIIDFIGSLFKSKKAVMSVSEAMDNINDKLKENADDLAKQIISYKKLQRSWKELKTEAEKNTWLKKNRTEYEKLGLAIKDINDAEKLFKDKTAEVITAFKARAAAAAADGLAQNKYADILKKQIEYEDLYKKYYEKYGAEGIRNIRIWEQTEGKGIGAYLSGDNDLAKLVLLRKQMTNLNAEVEQYYEISENYRKKAEGILGNPDLFPSDKDKQPRDLTDIIMRNQIKIQKMNRKALTDFIVDDFSTRKQAADDAYDNEIDKIDELIRKNDEYVANTEGKYKELTDAQKQQIAEQNKLLENTKVYIGWTRDAAKAQIDFEENIRSIQLKRNLGGTGSRFDYIPSEGQQQHVIKKDGAIDSGTQLLTSIEEEKQAWLDYLEWQQSIAIEANGLLTENQREQAEIVTEFEIKKRDIIAKYENIINELRQKDNEDRLQLVKKGTEEELNLLLEQNELARKAAIQENKVLPPEQQRSFQSIKDVYDKQANLIRGQFQINKLEQQQALDKAIFNEIKHNETEITKFTLEQEKTRLEKQIALAEAGMLDWSQVQIDEAKSTVKSINRELSELNSFVANIGKKGLGGTLLEKLGFDDEQIEAFTEAVSIIIEQLQSIADAEVELAEKAVEAAEAKVEAAQKAYDAEIEARNNGYAHNVATAKKELEQERKNQQQKQKILEAAQKRQESLNNITQASSLITASANLWNAFSSIPFIGPALAIAAIATMWTSFAAAKIKAKQVTNQSEEYGEGGLEFLEGGSHASGNDIDLHTKNKRKKNMRAEGGEALAIINKKQTRRYRKALPGIIDSLNRGTFEDKYLNAFNKTDGISFMLQHKENNIDLSKLEKEVSDIRKQSETKYYTLPNGNIVIISRNVKRIIKH